MIELPEPLTPADCDLKDFQFMPFDVQRLLKSETWVLGTGDERAAAISLWLESWHQVPAASLPKDDRMLAHLSQSGAKWKKIKAHVLRGWREAADGRLYHPVVAEKALEAWVEKLANSLSGAQGNAKRWGVEIETDEIKGKFLQALDMLRVLAPQSKTFKKKIVATIVAGSAPDKRVSPPDSPPDEKTSPPDTANVSPPDRNRQGQGQGQGQGLLTSKALSGASTDNTSANAAGDPPDERAAPLPVGRNVQISLLLRSQAVQATAQHPTVAVTWALNPKVTDDVLNVAIATARSRKADGEAIPVRYLEPIVADLVAQQDAPPAAAAPQKPREDWSWKRSNQGIESKARELGIRARPTESYPDLAARCEAEIVKRKGATA